MLSMSSMRPNRREIYRYNAPWPLFAMGWSQGPAAGRDSAFRLALGMCYLTLSIASQDFLNNLKGSFIEEYSNKVQVVALDPER